MAQGRAAPALAWTPGAARWPWRHRGTRRPAGAARFGGGLRCSSPHDLRIQTPQERCLQMAGGQAGTRAPRCRDAEQTSWGVREDPRPVQKVQSTPTSGVQLLPLIAPQLPGSGIQLVLQAQAAGSAQGGGVEEAGGGGAGGGGQPGIRLGLPAGHSGASVVPPVIGQAASVDEEEEGMQGGALHIHPPPHLRPSTDLMRSVCRRFATRTASPMSGMWYAATTADNPDKEAHQDEEASARHCFVLEGVTGTAPQGGGR